MCPTPENPPHSRHFTGLPPPIVYIAPMPRARLAANLAPIAILAAIAGLAPSALAQSFTLLGWPAPNEVSLANDVSADGRVVAGYSDGIGGSRGFLWTAETGRNDFGLPLPIGTQGFGISGDGNTAVGAAGTTWRAYKWNATSGYQELGSLPGYNASVAVDASFDGSVIVGSGVTPNNDTQAFRWTQAGGMQGLGPGTNAKAISSNGNVIVGTLANGPFRWTAGSGLQLLPTLDGSGSGGAFGVSHDGSIVIGRSGVRGAMWINGVPTDLTAGSTTMNFTPFSVSNDGSVVAGNVQATGDLPRAGIWTSATGMMKLSDYLIANGVALPPGIVFGDCRAVSADGRTFVGWTSPAGTTGGQAFVATIPAPCPADLDNDGLLTNGGTRDRAVTIDDLLFLLAAFESGNLAADLDNGSNTGTRDNAVTIDDLLYFLTHFEAGC